MRLSTLAFLLCTTPALAQSTATYRVTFDAAWSASTHPDAFPGSSAHFSPLVGTSHSAQASLWEPGGLATPGIEQMAETGGTSTLVGEIGALRAAGHASDAIRGPAVNVSPGAVSLTVTMDEAMPLLSLVTMIAPSPDWFVGVHGLDLRAGGAWVETLDVSLLAYDAGTDSGPAYTSGNQSTVPQAPISQLTETPFLVGGAVVPVGTLQIVRLSVTSGEDAADAASFALSAPAPNPARGATSLTLTLAEAQTVEVRLMDALGRTVAVLAQGPQPAGPLTVRASTDRLAAGVYTVVARGAQTVTSRRITVVR